MKSIFSTLAMASVLALSFTVHASDLRDMKESQMTTEQKKEAYASMSQQEIDMLDAYDGTKNYRKVINNEDKDLSFNEKIEIIKQEQKK